MEQSDSVICLMQAKKTGFIRIQCGKDVDSVQRRLPANQYEILGVSLGVQAMVDVLKREFKDCHVGYGNYCVPRDRYEQLVNRLEGGLITTKLRRAGRKSMYISSKDCYQPSVSRGKGKYKKSSKKMTPAKRKKRYGDKPAPNQQQRSMKAVWNGSTLSGAKATEGVRERKFDSEGWYVPGASADARDLPKSVDSNEDL